MSPDIGDEVEAQYRAWSRFRHSGLSMVVLVGGCTGRKVIGVINGTFGRAFSMNRRWFVVFKNPVLLRNRIRIWLRAIILTELLFVDVVLAGGSPETTLLVVNANSAESRLVANTYMALRDIPRTNMVWLDDVPASPKIDIEAFRWRIWQPIRSFLEAQDLEEQVDVIAYSAGFPYAVDFSKDLKGQDIPKANRRLIGKVASLTGLTFFARRVEVGDLGYLGRNLYFRRDLTAGGQAQRPRNEGEQALHKRARHLMKRKQYEKALALLSELSGTYPWDAHVWYDLAVSQAALARDSEALLNLEKAVEAGWRHSLAARSERAFKGLQDMPLFKVLVKRMQEQPTVFQQAHGFRGRYVWRGGFQPVKNGSRSSPNRYFLALMLGYTGSRGNSVEEVLHYLRRAAASDASHPDGAVYLLENRNIRAQTRERYFYATAQALEKRGRRVEIVGRGKGQDGVVPRNKPDVMGAVVGVANFDWQRSKSQLLAGAIAESLTSYGGDFENRKQTKLSEFLRQGAAGSSGAVAEPYSMQEKFPVAYMHVHYADGSSLAESFYQSIEVPYQLIVVGDPLTRPFARFSEVGLESPDPALPWKGAVLLNPKVVPTEGREVQRLELWVDGKFVDAIATWDMFLWDTHAVDDGYHELRIVAVDADRIETRSYAKIPVNVGNNRHRISARVRDDSVSFEDDIVLAGAAPGATSVHVYQGARRLHSMEVYGGRWEASLPANLLGPGRIELFARAGFPDGRFCRSIPLVVDIAAANQSNPRSITPPPRHSALR